jgi:hypothetical protein
MVLKLGNHFQLFSCVFLRVKRVLGVPRLKAVAHLASACVEKTPQETAANTNPAVGWNDYFSYYYKYSNESSMTKFSLKYTGLRQLADCHGKIHLAKKQ